MGAFTPAFAAVRHADGTRVQSADRVGKVVVLDFWGTWCEACRYEAPVVQQVAHDYAEQPVVVLALDATSEGDGTETRGDVTAFLKRASLPDYPVAYPEGDVAQRFGVHVFPTVYVLGKDGLVDFVGPGTISRERLAAAINAALKD